MAGKVNVFIVGAAKCGTTTLAGYFKKHPSVFVSRIKEPHFFSSEIDPENFVPAFARSVSKISDKFFEPGNDTEWPQAFVKKEKYYQQLFHPAKAEKLLDASTSYLWSVAAAKNIAEYNPNAKIIVILRDPAKRAFSHYLMAVRYGMTRANFREAWEEDLQKENRQWGQAELFSDLGNYGTQLQRYYDVFPKEQIKVVLQDDLRENPQKVVDSLCEFLNVSLFAPLSWERENAAQMPRSKWIRPQRFGGLKDKLLNTLSEKNISRIKRILYQSGESPVLGEEDRKMLVDFYRKEIHKTQELTGLDLQHWLN